MVPKSILSLLNKEKRIVMLGAPGSGKGTYAKKLSSYFKIPTLSSGDIIRDHILRKTDIGKEVEDITKRGDLIPDDLLYKLIKSRLNHSDTKNGFILDGIPRSYKQIKLIDSITSINLAIKVSIREDILIGKTLARRICPNCNEQYNLFEVNEPNFKMPPLLPKVHDICDNCCTKLITRSDDKKLVVEKRLKIYKKNIEPVLEEYKKRDILFDFELISGLNVMWPWLKKMFSKVR